MQSVLGSLPDETAIRDFVCRGLAEMPGVLEVEWSMEPKAAPEFVRTFPIRLGASHSGRLFFRLSDAAAFLPYQPYLENFCFMLAVVLEERRQRSLLQRERAELEQRIEERTGKLVRQMSDHQRLLKEADRVRRALLSTLEDQNRAEATLRLSEARFQLAMEASHDGLWDWNVTTNEVYYSPGYKAILGYPADEAIAHAEFWMEHIHPEDRTRTIAAKYDCIENRRNEFEIEFRMRTRNGEWRWILGRGKAVSRDSSGRATRLVGTHVDITGRKHAEAALRTSEERYRLLFDVNPHPMWVYDLETLRFLAVNDSAVVHYGYAREEFLGMCISDIRPPEDLPRLLANVQAVTGGVDEAGVWIHRKKDGTLIWVEITSHTLDFGERQAEVVLAHDVTERLRAEAALRESEDRYRSLVEESPDAIGIYQDDKLVFVNATGARLMGAARPDELLGRTSELLIHPEDQARAAERMRRRLAGETGVYPAEVRYLRLDGTVVTVEVSLTPIQFQGKPGMQFIARDITARKRAEEALRESEERLRLATEAARMGTWERNLRTGVLTWSPMAERLNGYEIGTFPGTEQALRALLHPDSISDYEAADHRVRHGDGVLHAELHFRLRDGRERWGLVVGRLIRDLQGGPDRIVAIDLDITDRRRLEAQLRQAQKLEAVGQLAGGVAHDFNNILAAILMQLGLLQMNDGLDGETRSALEDLVAEANRAANLTRQLLMFSRRSVLAVRPLDLNEVVANLLKMLGRLIGEQINLRFVGQTGLPSVGADVGMLEQVLMNLVVNARDAMPKGGRITISTDVAEFTESDVDSSADRRPGRFVCVTVADTGVGISEDSLKRIFEPFYTTKEPGKGTGLGLATVHGIVAQHKGWVEVESKVGQGTVFRVFLPAWASPAAPKEATVGAKPLDRGRESILLVEDNPQVRQSVGRTLRALGYRVYEAVNGREAMRQWQNLQGRVDLLLTDIVLPEAMTGLELAERLQGLRPALRVIITSGYSTEVAMAGAPSRPGLAYLPKPYETSKLASVVRSCLDGALND